jgi:hypothetical protein
MDSIGQRDRAATSMSLGNITAVNLKKQQGESGDTCPNIRYIKYTLMVLIHHLLKLQIGEDAEYDKVIARYKAEVWGDNWSENMIVV